MTDLARSLDAGARLGPYEILGLLGRGGMAEVYRANDTRLNRVVAIKVLANDAADRADRRQRLEREARAVSSLSHPHICALYDVGVQDGALFLVMELVAGETLAQRLQRGPLPLESVVEHATDIADALDHAHRQGITHRDLKPANIMLSPSGVKLLDFGLVKLREPERRSPDGSSPTESAETESLTDDGAILGTLPYMAPEQLEGGQADARSDIFAVGAIIYEMATARRAFTSESRAGLIASILEHDPPSLTSEYRARSRAGTDRISLPLLDHVVARCLAKQPEERWQTSADLTRELRWIAKGHAGADLDRPIARVRRARDTALLVTGGVLLAGALTLTAMWALRSEPPPAHAVRYQVAPEAGTSFASGPAAPQIVVSPDGQWLAYPAGVSSDQSALWVRGLSDLAARELPGTAGARLPFWSYDSQALGFFAGGRLKTVRLNGEPPKELSDAPEPEGGAWSPAGVIVFAPIQLGGLLQVPAGGGQTTPATHLDQAQLERKHGWPSFLPDGRRFLFYAKSERKERTGIYLQSIDGGPASFVMASAVRAAFAPPGYLLFGRDNVLMAQSFDGKRAALMGEAVPVAQGVAYANNGRMAFSVSDHTLVYRAGELGGTLPSALQWFDRSGQPVGAPIGTVARYGAVTASPDGTMVMVTRLEPTGWSLWLFDLAHGNAARQFADETGIGSPVWSSDSASVMYVSQRESLRGFVKQQVSGAGGEESVFKTNAGTPSSWSREGFLLYGVLDPATSWDVWQIPMSGGGRPAAYLNSNFKEGDAQFSPDGHWVVYSSDVSRRTDVWVQAFPTSDRRPIRISPSGGSHPQWRPDGRELFYLDADNSLMAVGIRAGATFTFDPPKKLFLGRVSPGLSDHYIKEYSVSRDGQRFLFKDPKNQDAPITVVLNWTADLPKTPKD